MPCRSKKRQSELIAAETPSWSFSRCCKACNVSDGYSATCASNQPACCSSGELLPPIGLAAVRPFSRHALAQPIAVDGATRKVRDAARADAPAFITSITRTRKSSEYGPGIAVPPPVRCRRMLSRFAPQGNPLQILADRKRL